MSSLSISVYKSPDYAIRELGSLLVQNSLCPINPLVLTPNAWTFGKLSPEVWNGIAFHEVLWSLLFAKTLQTPTILNYITSTATFLMAADAPWRARPYMLRPYIGSANPS